MASEDGISITGGQGGRVCAPVLLHTTVQGNVNISLNSSGDGACTSSTMASKDDIDIKSFMSDYKKSILPKYETVEEYNSLPCEDVLLADRYTQLLMVQKHRPRVEREEEIRTRGEAFHQVLLTRDAKDYESIRVENFFSPTDKGEAPRALLLQGHSGMGKSFTAQKIMHDWASGRLYANSFDVVFYLKCKELNLSRGEQSLMDLLQLESVFVPAMQEVLTKYPQKVLFLVDGFDELRLPLEISSSLPTDAFTRAPVAAVLSALLQGKILSRSSLLVTCRSTVSDKLSKLLKQPRCFTEILGFSEEGVEEYFHKFFNDQKLSSQAIDTVRSNEHLFAACFVPIISWIVCTVFRERIDYEMELITTTSVFVHFVSILLEHHCQGLSQPVPYLLRSLGQLAEKGILDQNVLFDEREVVDMVPDPVSVPFLCKFLVKKNVGKKTMFSFMHLSFQEFFTALFYATAEEEEGQSKVENLLQREARGDHHLLPVIYFLFGLSNRELGSTLKEGVHLSIYATLHTQLEKWIDQLNKVTSINHTEDGFYLGRDRGIDIFTCLYEHHEDQLTRKIIGAWESFQPTFLGGWESDLPTWTALSKSDCWVLLYCFQFCSIIKGVDLVNCNLTAEKLKMLKPVLCRCEKLRSLQVEDLSDHDIEDLITCLGEEKDLRVLCLAKSTSDYDPPPAVMRLIKSKLNIQGVQKIMTNICKQKSLDWFELEARSVALPTVEVLFDLLQRNFFEKHLSFEALVLTDHEQADPMMFLLSIEKNLYRKDSDSVIRCIKVTAECELSFHNQCTWWTQKRLKGFWLRLSLESQIATINWREFFHTCVADSQGVDEHVDALMVCLSRMSGLEEVTVTVNCLNESWPTGFIQLYLACPCLRSIECTMQMTDEGCAAVVHIDRHGGALRMCVKNYCPSREMSWFMDDVSPRNDLWLTCVLIILPFSPELQHLNWRGFFSDCLALQGVTDCPCSVEQVEALLAFLRALPELSGLRLDVGSLTEGWASGLGSLIHTCPTLNTVRLYCGERGYGSISEEGLSILQQSVHQHGPTVTVAGLKCRVPPEQCLTHNQEKHHKERVEITFSKGAVQQKDLRRLSEMLDLDDDPFRLRW